MEFKKIHEVDNERIESLDTKGFLRWADSEAAKFSNVKRVSAPVARRAYKLNIQTRRNKIRSAAVLSDIDLTELVSQNKLSEFIRYSTEAQTDRLMETKRKIHGAATTALRKAMPIDIRRIWKKYGENGTGLMLPSPGFHYKFKSNSARLDNLDLDFLIEPDVPRFFKQGTEVAMISEHATEYLTIIERHIEMYYFRLEKRYKMEIELASKLFGVVSLYDLLNTDPILFDKYIKSGIHSLTNLEVSVRLSKRFTEQSK